MIVDGYIKELREHVEARDFSGYDPYDALNSPFAPILTCGTKWGRIALTQLLRRSAINLRQVLLIRPGCNPKALALFLGAYCRMYRLSPDEKLLKTILRLVNLLELTRTPGFSGSCWGYNFPWQSRAFFAPRFTPTAVVSAFAGHALIDAYQATGHEPALNMAVSIRHFLLQHLNRVEEDGDFCFSYSPLDNYPVHNANMLAASLLVRLGHMASDRDAISASVSALSYTLKRQHPDGSWHYAERKSSAWIDSFHTGFVLESLRWFTMLAPSKPLAMAYERGVRFYAEQMFLPDGTPKYYHDRVYPIDIHSPAQAIAFFCGEAETWRPLTDAVLAWTLEKMRHPSGYFYFRRWPRTVNRIPYMRWAQAWMLHALTAYALSCDVARPRAAVL